MLKARTSYYKIWAVLLLMLPVAVHAQSAFPLKGILVKAGSTDRMAQVRIFNLHTGQVRLSDEHGFFTIPASAGDTLEFNKADYTAFRLKVENSNDVVVYLKPVTNLNTVVVKGYSTKAEQQATLDAYRSKGVYYNGKPPALSYIASPLNGLYELFGKEPKQARRFNNYIKKENEASRIDRRFNRALIKQITAIPDENLSTFIETYRPNYEDVNKWTDYELINYIKKSFASYQTLQRIKSAPLQTD